MDLLLCGDVTVNSLPENMRSQYITCGSQERSDYDKVYNKGQEEVKVGDEQTDLIENYEMTEAIVPPFTIPVFPQIARHRYPIHGTGILLITPTLNKFKTKLLKETFAANVPLGHTLHTISIAFDSGVSEQPYNSAGLEGAYNRITNALRYFDDLANQVVFREQKIGTVIVSAIENYIQIEDVERPTDYGVVVLHNATSGKTVFCLSQGVTVPRKYLDLAYRLGYERGVNYGKVSVGKVFAEKVPGIDHANWHEVVSGRSRYDILTEAVQGLQIPW